VSCSEKEFSVYVDPDIISVEVAAKAMYGITDVIPGDKPHFIKERTNTHTHVAGKRCGRQEETVFKTWGREELLCYFLRLRRSIRPKTMSQPITFNTVT